MEKPTEDPLKSDIIKTNSSLIKVIKWTKTMWSPWSLKSLDSGHTYKLKYGTNVIGNNQSVILVRKNGKVQLLHFSKGSTFINEKPVNTQDFLNLANNSKLSFKSEIPEEIRVRFGLKDYRIFKLIKKKEKYQTKYLRV